MWRRTEWCGQWGRRFDGGRWRWCGGNPPGTSAQAGSAVTSAKAFARSTVGAGRILCHRATSCTPYGALMPPTSMRWASAVRCCAGTGSKWHGESSGVGVHLRGVWGSSADDVLAVGDGGTVLRRAAGSWSSESAAASGQLNGVWGTAKDNVYVVGEDGVLLKYDGSWKRQPSRGKGSSQRDLGHRSQRHLRRRPEDRAALRRQCMVEGQGAQRRGYPGHDLLQRLG